MKTIEKKIYLFEELPLEKQQELIEQERNKELETLTKEDIIWDLSSAGEKVADAGFLNPDICFSLNDSPGDGAVFDCNLFNFELLLEGLEIPHKKWFIKLIQNPWHFNPEIMRNISKGSNRYFHEYTRKFILYPEINIARFPRVYKISKQIEHYIDKLRYDKCIEAKNEIRDMLNHITSDERVKERLIALEEYYDYDTLQSIDVSSIKEIEKPKDVMINLEKPTMINFSFDNCPIFELLETEALNIDKTKTYPRHIHYYLEGVLARFLYANHTHCLAYHGYSTTPAFLAIGEYISKNVFMTDATLHLGTDDGILLWTDAEQFPDQVYLNSLTYIEPNRVVMNIYCPKTDSYRYFLLV